MWTTKKGAFSLFFFNKIVKVLPRCVGKDPPQLPNTDKLNSIRSYSKGRKKVNTFCQEQGWETGGLCMAWSPPITATDVNFCLIKYPRQDDKGKDPELSEANKSSPWLQLHWTTSRDGTPVKATSSKALCSAATSSLLQGSKINHMRIKSPY